MGIGCCPCAKKPIVPGDATVACGIGNGITSVKPSVANAIY